jgi:predicted metalloendopeptidase
VKNNQHATPAFRVKGAVSNLPAFGQAFGCKAGASYNPVKRCELW